MNGIVRSRERGAISATDLSQEVSIRVLKTLALAETKRVARIHTAPLQSLAIDAVQQRYLLSAGLDTSIQLLDLEISEISADGLQQIPSLSHVASGSGHTRLVSTVEWYPVDSGMFSTSSFDHTLRVWDTATMTEACKFDLESRIYCHRMSPTGAHALIAAANESAYVRLCDLRTASAAQQIFAHQNGGTVVAWSPHQPYMLATGGADGALKLWDIRQSSACLAVCTRPLLPSLEARNETESMAAAHVGPVKSILFSRNTGLIASSGSDKCARIWQIDAAGLSPALLSEFPVGAKSQTDSNSDTSMSAINVIRGAGDGIGTTVEPSLTSSDDGTIKSEIMFYPNSDGTISGIELMTGECVVVLEGHLAPASCLAWRAGHMELYSGGADNNILIWHPPAAENMSDKQAAARMDSWSDDDDDDDR
ncbi:hypothetical protein GGI11_004173 [Coemansia sp. RSA 2049]|nr:hypothetical protein GGI11_004173 [Coemansia sp. RSA 2049]